VVKRHNQLMLTLLVAGDMAAAGAAWVGAYLVDILAVRLKIINTGLAMDDLAPAALLAVALCVPVFARFGLYQPKRTTHFAGELPVIMRAVFIAWCLIFVVAGLMKHVSASSRIIMGSVLLSWLLAASLERLMGRGILRWFRKYGWNQRYAAIVGTGRLGQTLFHCLKRNTWTGIDTSYFVDGRSEPWALLGRDAIGPYNSIEEILAERPVDIVFVALPAQEHSAVEKVLNRLARTEVDIRVVPDTLSFHFLRHELDQLDNLPIVTLTHTPLSGWNNVLKRTMDLALSAGALVVLALPMLLIALAVKLTSRGPIFYSQTRTSLGGRRFRIYKFRTMHVDAEKETGPVWASVDDPRITPLGRFLRWSSLDELPQFLNVLKGDMSLVGPRPERPELVGRFRRHVPRYMLRHHAKAGLTGWAQVHGLRGQTSLRKRVQYDMFYICNWTLGLDLRILLMTFFRFTAASENGHHRQQLPANEPPNDAAMSDPDSMPDDPPATHVPDDHSPRRPAAGSAM
jgi:Undecaprenyl-phosphate glucose phosphotransferase